MRHITTFAAAVVIFTGCTNPSADDTYTHEGGTLTGENTWPIGTHVVNGSLTISEGTLTIQAGAIVTFTSGLSYSLLVGKSGNLQILGSSSAPVTITSASSTPTPGDWGAIEISNGSDPNCTIQNANIAYGGSSQASGSGSASGAILIDPGASASIHDTTVTYSSTFGVAVLGDASLKNFTNNVLIHNTQGPISLTANGVGQLGQGTYAPNSVDAITVITSQMTQDATWSNLGVPYVLQGLTLETLTGTAVLTVTAGNTLKLVGGSLIVQKNGGLILAGTAQAPVTVTSANNPAARGDWQEIDFYDNSIGASNKISYANIEYGGGGSRGMVWLETGAKLTMQNTQVSNSADVGIYVSPGAQLENFQNNVMTKNAKFALSIDVDDVRQLQPFVNDYTGNVSEGILTNGTLLHTNTTWSNLGAPYVVSQLFAVDLNTGLNNTVTWTIDANTTIQFLSSAGVVVDLEGAIFANGTANAPVLFTAFDETQGWDSLHINSSGNILNHTILRFGGLGAKGALYVDGGVTCNNMAIGEFVGICNYLNCGTITQNPNIQGAVACSPQNCP